MRFGLGQWDRVTIEHDAAQLAAAHGGEAEAFCRRAVKAEFRPRRRRELELIRRLLRSY